MLYNINMDTFIEKSKSKFNDIFSYDNLNYISTKKPITLLCKFHNNLFTTSIKNHLDSRIGGCMKCDFDYRFNQFHNKSKEKFNNNFIINKETFNTGHTKTEIKCIKHNNIFSLSLQKHIRQKDGGCFKCNKNYNENMLKDTIEKSKNKFNDNYDFSDFKYILAKNKSKIRCKKHNNIIEISATEHINSIYGGCSLCVKDDKTVEINKKQNAIEKKKIKSDCKLETDEEFKVLNLANYENSYKISNYGKIYSLKNNIYMKPTKNNNGYMQIRLYDSNIKSKTFRIHQLVAIMFIENKENKKYVDHIDRCRDNNYYKNLRWVTHVENMSNTSKKRNIVKNNTVIEDNKNKFKQLGIINNQDYSDYSINEDGEVKNKHNKLLKAHINDGYKHIRLVSKTKEIKNFRIHRLVAYTYLNKPDNFTDNLVVNHIDENRLNNNYKNLEWCSTADNTKKYFENKNKTKIIIKKPKKIIAQVDIKTGNILNRFNRYIDACDYLKISKSNASNISYCSKGYRQTAHGYKWKILNE